VCVWHVQKETNVESGELWEPRFNLIVVCADRCRGSLRPGPRPRSITICLGHHHGLASGGRLKRVGQSAGLTKEMEMEEFLVHYMATYPDQIEGN